MKLLRAEFDSLQVDKLAEAVTVADRNNLQFTDTDVEQQLQYWMGGLLDNDQVQATSLAYGLCAGQWHVW